MALKKLTAFGSAANSTSGGSAKKIMQLQNASGFNDRQGKSPFYYPQGSYQASSNYFSLMGNTSNSMKKLPSGLRGTSYLISKTYGRGANLSHSRNSSQSCSRLNNTTSWNNLQVSGKVDHSREIEALIKSLNYGLQGGDSEAWEMAQEIQDKGNYYQRKYERILKTDGLGIKGRGENSNSIFLQRAKIEESPFDLAFPEPIAVPAQPQHGYSLLMGQSVRIKIPAKEYVFLKIKMPDLLERKVSLGVGLLLCGETNDEKLPEDSKNNPNKILKALKTKGMKPSSASINLSSSYSQPKFYSFFYSVKEKEPFPVYPHADGVFSPKTQTVFRIQDTPFIFMSLLSTSKCTFLIKTSSQVVKNRELIQKIQKKRQLSRDKNSLLFYKREDLAEKSRQSMKSLQKMKEEILKQPCRDSKSNIVLKRLLSGSHKNLRSVQAKRNPISRYKTPLKESEIVGTARSMSARETQREGSKKDMPFQQDSNLNTENLQFTHSLIAKTASHIRQNFAETYQSRLQKTLQKKESNLKKVKEQRIFKQEKTQVSKLMKTVLKSSIGQNNILNDFVKTWLTLLAFFDFVEIVAKEKEQTLQELNQNLRVAALLRLYISCHNDRMKNRGNNFSERMITTSKE